MAYCFYWTDTVVNMELKILHILAQLQSYQCTKSYKKHFQTEMYIR